MSGGLGAGLFYAAFIGLQKMGVNYFLASFVGFIFNTGSNYLFQKYWTFKNKQTKEIKREMTHYLLLGFGLLGGNTLLLAIGVEVLELPEITTQIIATCILTIVSYSFSKIIFKEKIKLVTEKI